MEAVEGVVVGGIPHGSVLSVNHRCNQAVNGIQCGFDVHGGLWYIADDVPPLIQVEWNRSGIKGESIAAPDAFLFHLDYISCRIGMHLKGVEYTGYTRCVARAECKGIIAEYLEKIAAECVFKKTADGIVIWGDVGGHVIPSFCEAHFEGRGGAIRIEHQGVIKGAILTKRHGGHLRIH